MLWKGRRESGNVSDRRGLGGGIAIGGGVLGVLYLIVNFLLGGGDVTEVLNQMPEASQQVSMAQADEDEERKRFVGVVLAETEDVWHKLFADMGMQYREPGLVLFSGSVQSGCGAAAAQMGSFYCPADEQVYIDLSFFRDLQNRFNAPGDFAMAYVIAHEVGHHIQNQMGVTQRMAELRERMSEKKYNRYSVMMELQADFYAGVWAHHAHKMDTILEPGDIEEALNAASAVGDDRLQLRSQSRIVPDAFTHGTSAQRSFWFRKGFETGDIRQGDTFNASGL